MTYHYANAFEDFPPVREALEAAGVVIVETYTEDSQLHVVTAEDIPAELAAAHNLTVV